VRAETVLDRDINDTSQLVQNVRLTADKLCHKMKTWNFQAKSMTFVLTYADYRAVRKAARFPFPTNDLATIAPVAVRVFEELYQRRVAIKSIRLNVNRTGADTGQLSLFETDADRKQRHLDDALVDVRRRMGFHSIMSASYLEVAE
jgi:nucleotidyltransferase/DNA polymerase involved in DNA repair